MVGSNIKTMVWETMLLGNRARNSMACPKGFRMSMNGKWFVEGHHVYVKQNSGSKSLAELFFLSQSTRNHSSGA